MVEMLLSLNNLMSLTISLVKVGPNTGQILDDQELPNGNDSAGAESWRGKVYGSQSLLAFGATFLPQLTTGDLVVWKNDQLLSFKTELELLIDKVDLIADETEEIKQKLLLRFQNILEAISLALDHKKGLWIS